MHHARHGEHFAFQHRAGQVQVEIGGQHEYVLDQRIDGEKARIAHGLEIHRAVHRLRGMEKIPSYHHAQFRRAVGNQGARPEEVIDRRRRIHAFKAAAVRLRHCFNFRHTRPCAARRSIPPPVWPPARA
jgi:hypothetical protein